MIVGVTEAVGSACVDVEKTSTVGEAVQELLIKNSNITMKSFFIDVIRR